MCCGQTRSSLKANGNANQAAMNLMYQGHAPGNVRGPVTGQLYQFSQMHPVRPVDARGRGGEKRCFADPWPG